MKSGYRVLVTEHLQNSNYFSPNVEAYKGFYKSFYPMHIPAKIKIHIWRLFNNFLPHFCNLFQRTLRVEVNYPLCKAAPKDSNHLLRSCGILQ